MFWAKNWGILIKKESENLIFTGSKIPRDYINVRRWQQTGHLWQKDYGWHQKAQHVRAVMDADNNIMDKKENELKKWFGVKYFS